MQEASLAIISGKLPTDSEMERYQRAIEWSKRVIALAARDNGRAILTASWHQGIDEI